MQSGCSRSRIYFRFLALISLRSTRAGGLSSSRECNMDPVLYDDSNRNSTERTRHRLEIRFEFAGRGGRGDERAGVAMGASGGKGGRGRRGRSYGRPQGSSFIHGAFTRYPRKADLPPASLPPRPSSLLPLVIGHRRGGGATPCASLHHSLVRRNGSGSGGYNIFLEDSFSSAVDHGTSSLRPA